MKPVIGLSSYAEQARWAVWDSPAVLLPLAYAEQVAAAGGVPVLLPPLPGIGAAAGRLDGLVLTGGGDIGPAAYRAEPHPRTARVSEQRDRAELDLLAAGLAGGLPVLGICRGLQILNVARGGTLHQHLPDVPGLDDLAAHTPAPGSYGSHLVRIAPASRLAEILGPAGADGPGAPERAVPTSHHQAIDRLGDGLRISARAPDGTVEAIEDPSRRFLIGVQWHAETLVHRAAEADLFRRFVEACRDDGAEYERAAARREVA